jgi:hypothetical protein
MTFEELVQAVLSSCGGVVRYNGCSTEEKIRTILQKTVVSNHSDSIRIVRIMRA